MYVIGIDAGGTKTVCLLADERGQILAEGRGPGANLHIAGEEAVEQVLRDLIRRTLAGHDIEPEVICVGIAGVDREHEARTIHGVMRRIGQRARVIVVNDAFIALTAGARDAAGIVIIAGTGSIVYGRNHRGEAARAGGWGYMLGDEGSGYWIGREALMAVMRASDGRGPSTALTAGILEHFHVSDVSLLPTVVYDGESPQLRVAALGPLVQTAAETGDTVAVRIRERAADELVLAARSVASRLEMRGDPFVFVLSGSIFRLVPSLFDVLQPRLTEVAPRAAIEPLTREPAAGAVWLALQEAHGGATVPAYRLD
jgi:N-acetylglucosamine kinase